MLKLFKISRRALTFKSLSTDSKTPFLFISRLMSQSLCDDPYDPPFSPVSKPAKPKKKKKKNWTQGNESNTKKAPTLPVKSDLPFDFRYSYSESNPSVAPISFRESPKFSPFGPGRLDRKWTGTTALAQQGEDRESLVEERNRILGDPLTEEEVAELVERYRHSDCNRQINIAYDHNNGKATPTYHGFMTKRLNQAACLAVSSNSEGNSGVTHNMLDDIHNHWKRAEAVRIKCLGVPTLDMDNVCFHLEEKSGGKIIYQQINVLLLCRGRNYDPKSRPVVPLMLWKPYAPVYPKLVTNVADGLTFEETKELRNRGLNSEPLMKLTRNGVYVNVVEKVREAFKTKEVVRLDCKHVFTSDCKKIGVKLRDLVPCIPIFFKDEQIILWRGKTN